MHDADPNFIKNSKSWPLGDAIFTNGSNSLEIVKKLLEYGSEPYESNGYKNAFYTVAGKYCVESDTRQQLRLVEIMEYLLNNSGETPQFFIKVMKCFLWQLMWFLLEGIQY